MQEKTFERFAHVQTFNLHPQKVEAHHFQTSKRSTRMTTFSSSDSSVSQSRESQRTEPHKPPVRDTKPKKPSDIKPIDRVVVIKPPPLKLTETAPTDLPTINISLDSRRPKSTDVDEKKSSDISKSTKLNNESAVLTGTSSHIISGPSTPQICHDRSFTSTNSSLRLSNPNTKNTYHTDSQACTDTQQPKTKSNKCEQIDANCCLELPLRSEIRVDNEQIGNPNEVPSFAGNTYSKSFTSPLVASTSNISCIQSPFRLARSRDEQNDDTETSSESSPRKKIKIDYIDDPRNRQVTFLKRKNGVMKKAMELVRTNTSMRAGFNFSL